MNTSLFLSFYLVSESDFGLFQYLARGVTGYIGKLREFLKSAGTKVCWNLTNTRKKTFTILFRLSLQMGQMMWKCSRSLWGRTRTSRWWSRTCSTHLPSTRPPSPSPSRWAPDWPLIKPLSLEIVNFFLPGAKQEWEWGRSKGRWKTKADHFLQRQWKGLFGEAGKTR